MINPVVLIVLIACSISIIQTDTLCDLYTTASREIKNDGFHRLLEINVTVDDSLLSNKCYLAIHQVLPSGMFVDPDQLNEISDFKKSPENLYFIYDTVNTEASENVSKPINIFIIHNADYKERLTDSKVVGCKFTLPVHIRYHSPQYGGQYKKVLIPSASVLVRCDLPNGLSGNIGSSTKSKCMKRFDHSLPCDVDGFGESGKNIFCDDWFQIDSNVMLLEEKSNNEELTLIVPVGDLNHFFPVQIITLFVTNFSAVFVLCYLFTKVH